MCAVQDGNAESSAGSNDALCTQTPGSAHSATSQPVSSSFKGPPPASTAAPDGLHCSASSCDGEPCAKPQSGRKLKALASWRSADEEDDVSSVGSLKRQVSVPLARSLHVIWIISNDSSNA